jgi:methylglutaconyl-CoA hydratase
MDESDPILWRIDDRGVAYITLNRPQVYNAYNGEMIAGLLAAFDSSPTSRCVWP